MGNVKMGTDGSYRTSDLYIAAWLLSRGLGLKDIDRRNKQRSDFIFRDRSDRPEAVKPNYKFFPLHFTLPIDHFTTELAAISVIKTSAKGGGPFGS